MFLLFLAIFLFPLAVYCGVLGMVNRRVRPLLVGGHWDFAGVLFASSGLLLVLAPALISALYLRNLFDFSFNFRGQTSQALQEIWSFWWGLWLLYYLALVAGAVFLLWLRSRSTVIYNVNPEDFEKLFLDTLDQLGLSVQRLGNRYALRAGPPRPEAAKSEYVSAEPLPVTKPVAPLLAPHEQVILDVDAFALLYNVTLHWRVFQPPVRAEIERALERGCAQLETPENATATWFLSISSGLFLLIFLALGALIFGSLPRR